jgi:cytochrome c-type biogenesis protein CcmH/NrfG
MNARGFEMQNQPNPEPESKTKLFSTPILVMCIACLGMGFLAGYLLRGSAPTALQARSSAPDVAAPPPQAMGEPTAMPPQPEQQAPHKMPTLDDLKHMADKKAAPLLEKLKSDEKNPQLENQVGLIYENAHQFKDAAGHFEKSLQYDPKNIGVRADYASCLFYTGDVDGALAQLNQSLTYDPKHAGTLMNIGIIKWRGKKDVDGAVAAWEKVLQYHPDFPQKALVEHMIAEAKQSKSVPAANKGDKG